MALTAETIKQIRALHSPKGRAESRLFIAEGVRTIATFIEASFVPQALYVASNKLELLAHLPAHLSVESIPARQMESISASSSPSGILAVFSLPAEPPLSKLSEGIVLAQVTDPGNMGTLIRSAVAFGYKTVVIIEGCDPYSPKVVQATAGSLAHVQLFRLSWDELVKNKKDLSLCALVAREGKQPEELNLSKTLLVVGNEAHGLPDQWVTDCDTHLTLPMRGNVESLNAGVAGSIALFLASVQK